MISLAALPFWLHSELKATPLVIRWVQPGRFWQLVHLCCGSSSAAQHLPEQISQIIGATQGKL